MGRILCVALCTLMLMACSRSVQWEEEVPLNSGETIWVKRSGTYSFKAAPGGVNLGWGQDWRSTIEFTYKGKRYKHSGELRLVLLSIAPDGTPNLFASLGSDWGWKHKYYCVTPYYVQLRADQTGKKWSWPEKIEQWSYDLPTNLLIGLAPLEADRKKFSVEDRATINAGLTGRYKHLRVIDQAHTVDYCPRRN